MDRVTARDKLYKLILNRIEWLDNGALIKLAVYLIGYTDEVYDCIRALKKDGDK